MFGVKDFDGVRNRANSENKPYSDNKYCVPPQYIEDVPVQSPFHDSNRIDEIHCHEKRCRQYHESNNHKTGLMSTVVGGARRVVGVVGGLFGAAEMKSNGPTAKRIQCCDRKCCGYSKFDGNRQ